MSELLRAAIDEEFGSVRAFARHLAGGPGATHEQIERQRRKLHKHMDGQQPGPERARLYARELGKPPDYFMRPIERRSRHERDLEVRVAELREEAEQLRAELARLRQAGQK